MSYKNSLKRLMIPYCLNLSSVNKAVILLLLMSFGLCSTAQIITGTVKDATGNPLQSATVSLSKNKASVQTNSQGYFTITAKTLPDTLRVSYVGYEVATQYLTAAMHIQLELQPLKQMADEVVVQTGYQQIRKERLTGSAFTVDDKAVNQRVNSSIIARLEGISSGLVFNVTPQGNKELGVRGRSTIFANSTPLIVVDNFPFEGDISQLNPNDVASVTILKDAAAAAIWGVRAGNGVIVITTKKGSFNKALSITYNTGFLFGDKPDLFYDPNYITASDFIETEKILFSRGYYTADENSLTKNPLSPVVELLIKKRDGLINADEAERQINAFRNNDSRSQLQDFFYRKSFIQQHAINLSGGSNSHSYSMGAGLDNHSNAAVGNEYRRISINTTHQIKLNTQLSADAGLFFTRTQTERDNIHQLLFTGGSSAKKLYPYAAFTDEAGNALPIVKDYRYSFIQNNPVSGLLDWTFVPLEEKGKSNNQIKQDAVRAYTGIQYQFNRQFSAEIRYQYQSEFSDISNLNTAESYTARNTINRYASVTGNQVTAYNVPQGAIMQQSFNRMQSNNIRTQLHYTYLGSSSNLKITLGMEARATTTQTNTRTMYGYNSELSTIQEVNTVTNYNLYPNGNARIPVNNNTGLLTDRFRSWYGLLGYELNNKYIVTASARIDQANYFGVNSNQRSVPLWSTGFAWIISKEKFYHFNALPQLKARISYGFNGNLDRSLSAYTTARYIQNASLTGLNYANIINPPNADLRWEKTSMINLGLDFSFKRDWLSGSIDFFHKKGSDLIGDAPMAPTTGVTAFRGNYAAMQGKGIDVVLKLNIINRQNFSFKTNLLISYATDKVTEYNTKLSTSNYIHADGNTQMILPVAGKPVYGLYSYRYGGLDAMGDPMGYIADTLSKNYAALLNPATIDLLEYNGPSRPVIFGGIRNQLVYKNFELSFSLSYKLGYYFRRTALMYNALFASWQGHQEFSDRWQKPGDEHTTTVPGMPVNANTSRDNFYAFSSATIEKADHIRLQEIILTYTLNKNSLKTLPFKNIQLYAMVNNVGLLWTANRKGLDPDYYRGDIPEPRSYGIGLRIHF